jgi:hypothetical protein
MEYLDTLKKYVSGKKYANQAVRSADGTIAYVTSTGVSKQFSSMADYTNTVGKNNCPEFIQLTPKWTDLGFPVGSTMKAGQSCGNENTYVQAEPPKNNFDWKFYLNQNPDLGKAGITTEQQANNHWNQYGKQEGRLPNATIMNAMNQLGKVGYIDVDATFHKAPSTPGDYKAFTARSNVTGTKMEDCSKPIPSLKYGVPIVFTQNNQKGSLQSTSLVFGTTGSDFFFRPPPGDDRQNQVIKYGDKVCITSSSSSYTKDCGWWGCKVGSVVNKQLVFGSGGEKPAFFYIIPPKENLNAVGSEIKYGFPFMLVSIPTANAAKLPKGVSVNCKPGTEPSGMPTGVYRYSGNNTLQYYPTPEIASSWNSNWGSSTLIDCSTYQLGENATKSNVASLSIGDAVGCNSGKDLPNGVQGGIYRYVGDNVLRWYPNPDIANAWDSAWSSHIKWSDCTTYKAGEAMTKTLESTAENESTPMVAYVSNGKMVFGYWTQTIGSNVFSTYYDNSDTSCDLNLLKQMCTNDCAGIVHSPSNNTWQKITPSASYKITSTTQDFYMKDATVDLKDDSCDTGKVQFIDSTLFSNYPQGNDLHVGGTKQCKVIAPPTPYKGSVVSKKAKEMANYKPNTVALQRQQQQNTMFMKDKTDEYKEVTQGIKNTPTMDTLEQQYIDMTVFDNQHKVNMILWGVISTTILAILFLRK